MEPTWKPEVRHGSLYLRQHYLQIASELHKRLYNCDFTSLRRHHKCQTVATIRAYTLINQPKNLTNRTMRCIR